MDNQHATDSSEKPIKQVRVFPANNRTLTVLIYENETCRVAIETRSKHVEFDLSRKDRKRLILALSERDA
jgi:hypothetical protein